MWRLLRVASIALLLTGGLWLGIEMLASAPNPNPRELTFAGTMTFLGLLGNAACALRALTPGGNKL